MGHLEGNFTPVLYMGRKVPKGYIKQIYLNENVNVKIIWKCAEEIFC
jgi:hypothetical protein